MTSVRSDGWTDFELSLLYDVVNDEHWFQQVEPHIGRSENAIRKRMSMLRAEAGIAPRHRGPRAAWEQVDHRRKARDASRKLTLALLALDEAAAPALSEHERHEADTLRTVQEELAGGRVEVQLAFLDGPLFDWGERQPQPLRGSGEHDARERDLAA